jgi:hypothetical protein
MEKVIVYRSQYEAKIDELLWNGDFGYIFGYLFVWVAVFYGLHVLFDSSRSKWKGKAIFVASIPLAVGVGKLLA